MRNLIPPTFALLTLALGCAEVDTVTDATGVAGGGADAGGTGGTTSGGTTTGGTASGGTASGGGTAGTGGDAGAGTAGDYGGLDSELGLPPAENEPCTTPGSSAECDTGWCRMSGPTSGRCEDCTTYPDCGTYNKDCQISGQCDLGRQCYQGKCRLICPLDTIFCGGSDCKDVGHATHGICPDA